MRHVRTQEGVKRFNLPLGAPITAEAILRAKANRGGSSGGSKGGSSGSSSGKTSAPTPPAHVAQTRRVEMDGSLAPKAPARRAAAGPAATGSTRSPYAGRRSAAPADLDARVARGEISLRQAERLRTGQAPAGQSSLARESTLDGDHKVEVGSTEYRLSQDAKVQTPKSGDKAIAYVRDPQDGDDLHVLTETGEVPLSERTKAAVVEKIDAEPGRFSTIKPVPAEGTDAPKASGRRAKSREQQAADRKPDPGAKLLGREMDGTPIRERQDGTGKRKATTTAAEDAAAVERGEISIRQEMRNKAAREAAETDDISLPGGQVPAGPDAAASAAADRVIASVSQIEPDVTKQMQALAKKYGGTMEGLDFRLKAKDSMVRKIKADAIEKNVSADVAASQLGDAIRYTMLNEPENHTAMVQDVLSDFEGQGYRLKVKNFWLDRQGTYRGINAQLQHPDTGTVIELQFNTPDSYKVKMEANHILYEQQRVLPKTDPKWKELNDQMVKNSQGIPRPADVLKIQPKNDIRFEQFDSLQGSDAQKAASRAAATARDVNKDK